MHRLAFTLGAILLLTGCEPSAGPEQTLELFLESVRAGDGDAARSLLVAAERADQRVPFDGIGLRDGFTILSVDVAEGRAELTVAMESQTPLPAHFVLLREEGAWRISLVETVLATLRKTPAELAQQLEAEEVGEVDDVHVAAPPGGQ